MVSDFSVVRGTRKSWTITVPDDGSGLTFAGAKIYVAVRPTTDPANNVDDSDAMIHDSTDIGGLVIVDAINRIFIWTVAEAATKAWPVGVYAAGFKWVPSGETDARQLDVVKTFEILKTTVRAI